MTERWIYLDHGATTPIDPRVLEAMLPYFKDRFGNAASHQHAFGWEAEAAVEMALSQIAGLLNVPAQDILLTSGATESNNLALKGVFGAYRAKGNHIITSSIEQGRPGRLCGARRARCGGLLSAGGLCRHGRSYGGRRGDS